MKPTTKPLLLIALCLAWILPGLIGHDPWKADEAYSFGLVYHILDTGDWVVPHLASEPFMEKPPLYYITAAAAAKLFSPWLPHHDGARLASAFYLILALAFAGLAGSELWGRGQGRISVLTLIGCPSLLFNTHMLITDVALFAGFAMAFYGLALCRRRYALGGFLLGTGVGVGFLSKGLIAPGMIGVTAVALPALSGEWRTRDYARALGVALAASLPWLLVWPVALYRRSPQLFMDWFWLNNLGRFAGYAHLGPVKKPGYYLGILPYVAWPMLPLAFWTAVRVKRAELKRCEVFFPLCAATVILAVLGLSSDAREIYALPLLLPLSLLAPPAVSALSPRVSAALVRFGFLAFGLLAMALWACWFALMTGVPAAIAKPLGRLAPAYVPSLNGPALAAASAYTLLWLLAAFRYDRSAPSAIFHWAVGVTMVWGIAMTLWLPWLDSGKSYRGVISDLRNALPERYECIASRGLGEPQRALLDYFAEIRTLRQEVADSASCDLLLVQGPPHQEIDPGPQWRKIWEESRPGDTKERFRLFQRVDGEDGRVATIAGKLTTRPTALAENARATRSP